MVAHLCNPSYFRGSDQENNGLRVVRQKVSETLISTNNSSMLVHAYNLSYIGGMYRKIMIETDLEYKMQDFI
jgi:hypothetical protein